MPKKLDLTGEKYGNLTVIGRCAVTITADSGAYLKRRTAGIA